MKPAPAEGLSERDKKRLQALLEEERRGLLAKLRHHLGEATEDTEPLADEMDIATRHQDQAYLLRLADNHASRSTQAARIGRPWHAERARFSDRRMAAAFVLVPSMSSRQMERGPSSYRQRRTGGHRDPADLCSSRRAASSAVASHGTRDSTRRRRGNEARRRGSGSCGRRRSRTRS